MRVDGVTEEKGETWKDCDKKVLEILKDKLEIEDMTTERAHRLTQYQNNKSYKYAPRTILSKLINYNDKTRIS